MNVAIAEVIQHQLAKESDGGVTILQGFQRRGRLTDLGEQRSRLFTLAGLLGDKELVLQQIESIKRGQEFEATAIMQILAFGRGRFLSIAERPVPRLKTWLAPRIDKLGRRLELRWCNHGTLNKRELS